MPQNSDGPATGALWALAGLSLAVLLVLVLVLVQGRQAHGQENDPDWQCLSADDAMHRAREYAATPGVLVRIIEGVEAQAFIAGLNRAPPVSAWAGEKVVLVTLGNGLSTMAILKGEVGCMSVAWFPASVIEQALGKEL